MTGTLQTKDYPEFGQNSGEIAPNFIASENLDSWGAGTNNQWLIDKLNEFEKNRKFVERKLILTEIGQSSSKQSRQKTKLENPAVFSRQNRQAKTGGNFLHTKNIKRKKEGLFKIVSMEWLREGISARADFTWNIVQWNSIVFFRLQMLLYALVLGVIGRLSVCAVFLFNDFWNRGKKGEKNARRVIFGRATFVAKARKMFSLIAERREGNLQMGRRKGPSTLFVRTRR